MFFYLFEHLNNYVKTPFIFATVVYILLNGYLKNTLNLFFWSVFIVDVLLTYYKKTLVNLFDKNKTEEEPKEEAKELKTTKSGYFDIDLDFMSTSKSSKDRSTIDKLVQDSKSL
jgi:hypothetical protein